MINSRIANGSVNASLFNLNRKTSRIAESFLRRRLTGFPVAIAADFSAVSFRSASLPGSHQSFPLCPGAFILMLSRIHFWKVLHRKKYPDDVACAKLMNFPRTSPSGERFRIAEIVAEIVP